MQLSQKQKIFFFEHFQKNDNPHRWCIFDFTDFETCGSVNVKNVPF